MSRILILTVHSGGGHVSLAEALRDRLAPEAAVAIADPLPGAVHAHYRLASRHALWLWDAEFRLSNTPGRAIAIHRALSSLLGWRLRQLLRRQRPHLVVSTSSMLTRAAQRALARIGSPAPFAMLFADPERLHATWLSAVDAEATMAPTRESYREALGAGFSPDRTHLTGWPVRAQFLCAGYERGAVLRQLGLDPGRFTVFVQGGREGTAHIARTVESVLAAGATQAILAAGTNRSLAERFAGRPGVRVVPFTREVAPLMAAADLVLGKAGPNTLIEAVMLGRPFVATTYIPGQEAGNPAMIERYGLGWVALDPAEQRELIAALARDPARMASVAAAVARYRDWNSAATRSIGPLLRELAAPARSDDVVAV